MASRERALTVDEAKALLADLPAHQHETVLFALATGLRQSNILKLEWSQVNLELRHAWIHGMQSKNRRPIAVPLNDIAIAVLQRQIGKHETSVFTYLGGPLKAANTRAWGRALKRAGIKDFRWHDLDIPGRHGNDRREHLPMSYRSWVGGKLVQWWKDTLT